MTEKKSVIIIGGGISGLSAGVYSCINGFETTIFEQSSHCGGVCAGYKREGFQFETCIHALNSVGESDERAMTVWRELGVLGEGGVDLMFPEMYMQCEDSANRKFRLFADPVALEKEIKTFAKNRQEEALAASIAKGVRGFEKVPFYSVSQLGSFGMYMSMIPKIPLFWKWRGKILDSISGPKGFSDSLVVNGFRYCSWGMDGAEIPMMLCLLPLAHHHTKTYGWPKGGALSFIGSVEARFKALGGQLHTSASVQEIMVDPETHQATGVVLEDGTKHLADYVISASDGYNTHFNLLKGAYLTPTLKAYYAKVPDQQQYAVLVALGLDRDMKDEPHALCRMLDEPFTVGGVETNRLYMRCFDSSTTMAPEGKGVLQVEFDSKYSFWKEKSEDKEAYDAAKKELVDSLLDLLEPRFPGIKEQVIVSDVSTLLARERWAKTHHGLVAWPQEGASFSEMMKGIGNTLPGLKHFYMIGQWATLMGSLFFNAMSGRNAIKEICKETKRSFITEPKA